jgi:hypothetical protein
MTREQADGYEGAWLRTRNAVLNASAVHLVIGEQRGVLRPLPRVGFGCRLFL